ncbi:molecular chaperone [Polaromonas sp. P1-6]|nr:molecular chaperone [Polaromonas sp. P1-6]
MSWSRFGLQGCGLLLGALFMLLAASPASADLMLYPTRIMFDKNQRAAQLELINNGQESATYRISVVNRRMSETGEFSAVDSPLPGEQFSDALLRYSPRQVVLAPGAGQTVRISLRKPSDLPAGEYRSHLQFDRVPEASGASSLDAQGPKLAAGEVGVQLKALIGVSIPVIVRHGETAANVTLAGLELLKPKAGQAATLAVVLQRSGNRSVYGDLGAMFTPQGGAVQEVGKAGGVAVYTPNALRRVKLELQPSAGLVLARGTLRVTFRERPDAGGKLLAEAAIELP